MSQEVVINSRSGKTYEIVKNTLSSILKGATVGIVGIVGVVNPDNIVSIYNRMGVDVVYSEFYHCDFSKKSRKLIGYKFVKKETAI